MTADYELNQEMAAAVEEMLRDGRLEGLVRQVQSGYPGLAHEAEAAVGHAVEVVIRAEKSPNKPFSYLTACAYNEIRRIGKFLASQDSLEALREDYGWEPAFMEWSAEERALVDETYKHLSAHVATWENNNVRIVTATYLEAIHGGDPPTAADVADELSAVTGSEVSADEVRTWKSRGFKRLRTYINNQRRREGEDQE